MPYYKKTYRSTVPVGPYRGGGGSKSIINIGGGGYNVKTLHGKGGHDNLARYQAPKKKGASFVVDTEDKSFDEIRQECLDKGVLFEDPEFPANDDALFFSQRPRVKFEWKRPHDICDDPKLFVGGASRFDIKQGELGDCWLLAAIASLSLNESLLYRIIPQDQTFAKGYYSGIFHFQFWQYGEWIDVLVDDLLPTYNNRLVYLHSADKNEFWSALLEKAYAKLNGSYEALKGGSTTEAMEDFTGGVTETYELREAPKNLFQLMRKSLKKGALMGCAIETQNMSQRESKLSNGLIMGHAYSITGVEKLQNGTKLVRIRNPWGQVEWKGAWSDDSSSWKSISESERKKLEVDFGDDGEFWMSFDDFSRNYTKLEICNLGPDALEEDDATTTWVTSLHEGRWIRGCTAGGCRNFPDTFWVNPQFRLSLEEEDDDPDDDQDGCSFILSLIQKNRRKQKAKGQGILTIGFALYKLKECGTQPVRKEFFLYNASVARSKNYINLRENSQRFRLPPGDYVIVPSTFQPNEEADFVLRIFTEKRSGTAEMDNETKQDEKASLEPVTDPHKHSRDQQESDEHDQKFKQLFEELTGDDGEIDAFELQDIINSVMKKNSKTGKYTGFGIEACRSMVSLMDYTRSGRLDYDEFKNLWVRVRKWINIFKDYDKDGSGCFDSYELRQALEHAGYSLSCRLYEMLCVRYASKQLTINMDDFILLSVRLEAMFKAFKSYRSKGNKDATLSLEEWLVTTMYA
ncbi:calpain-9-like isoform X2 [Styela clava]|uniref:calpain-9-like isoform X2 n=1 Tax=Styela clava TaxID=7725 RepID=UPI00193A1DDA|nr:calpain-9-like isoform X2 [Styela clava]